MIAYKQWVRRTIRPAGWEIRRFDPDIALDTYLWSLFQHLQINCVLDVGAHFGEFAGSLRENGYAGHIVSFEPVSASFDKLTALMGRDPMWSGQKMALGSADTTAEINVANLSNFSSFLDSSPNAAFDASDPKVALFEGNVLEHKETVRVARLDSVLREITAQIPEPKIYLKLDTQGWDLEAVKGCTGCLSAIRAMQTELSLQPIYHGAPSWMESVEAIQRLGFEVSAFFPVCRDSRLRLLEADCVMVRSC